MENFMVMELTLTKMVIDMLENGKMPRCMEKEPTLKMVIDMW